MLPRFLVIVCGLIFVLAGLGKAMDVTTASESLIRFGLARPMA